jgi:uncharacterized membrane protein YkoI
MNMKTLTTPLAISLLTALSLSVNAEKTDEIVQRLSISKVSLQQAVQIAESHLSGQAYKADLEDDNFANEYEVKLVAKNRRYEVTVDSVTGEVKRVRPRN